MASPLSARPTCRHAASQRASDVLGPLDLEDRVREAIPSADVTRGENSARFQSALSVWSTAASPPANRFPCCRRRHPVDRSQSDGGALFTRRGRYSHSRPLGDCSRPALYDHSRAATNGEISAAFTNPSPFMSPHAQLQLGEQARKPSIRQFTKHWISSPLMSPSMFMSPGS
jgi:hypothetical protein